MTFNYAVFLYVLFWKSYVVLFWKFCVINFWSSVRFAHTIIDHWIMHKHLGSYLFFSFCPQLEERLSHLVKFWVVYLSPPTTRKTSMCRFITLICTGYWTGTKHPVQMWWSICTGRDTRYICLILMFSPPWALFHFLFLFLSFPFMSFIFFSHPGSITNFTSLESIFNHKNCNKFPNHNLYISHHMLH
jgi:hypothetical protein